MPKTSYFITVEWCGNGFRGVFCNKAGIGIAKDGKPHTDEEMDQALGPFFIILHPQSEEMSEADLARYECFVPLAEYSHEWGIALTVEDQKAWWEAAKEKAREVSK
jgi:hypothetical protein